MNGKLAVLMPVFNGGALLEESIRSCAESGLDPQRYEILLVDNCSTDGAVDRLAAAKPGAVPVRIFRNSGNLGRIGNWNRAVEIAEEEGFAWATFLFVGDVWLPGGSLPRILALMEEHGADFALSSRRWICGRTVATIRTASALRVRNW
jgi:glycosyltransferase involved in cell wall biosynthesis